MTTQRHQVYKCEKCGNVVAILHSGAPSLVCCGEPMKLLEEHTADSTVEKHVPVVEKSEAGVTVKVGSVAHPMESAHYIEWIEVVCGGREFRAYLEPGVAPVAEFPVRPEEISMVREYCNVHGLWKA